MGTGHRHAISTVSIKNKAAAGCAGDPLDWYDTLAVPSMF